MELLHHLYDNTTAIGDLHVQAMAVEQEHTCQRRGIRLVCLDKPRLTVPEYRDAPNSKGDLAAIGKGRSTMTLKELFQFCNYRWWQGQKSVVAGVNHGVNFPCLPRRAAQ